MVPNPRLWDSPSRGQLYRVDQLNPVTVGVESQIARINNDLGNPYGQSIFSASLKDHF
jgi:hypothetical protein